MTRNRTLTVDDARAYSARALDDAMRALRVSNEDLGAILGCDEAIVRRMRQGARPVTAERIMQMPAVLRSEYLARLSATAERADQKPLVQPTPEAAARLAAEHASQFAATALRALRDGHLSDGEKADLRECIADLHRAMNPLRAAGDA